MQVQFSDDFEVDFSPLFLFYWLFNLNLVIVKQRGENEGEKWTDCGTHIMHCFSLYNTTWAVWLIVKFKETLINVSMPLDPKQTLSKQKIQSLSLQPIEAGPQGFGSAGRLHSTRGHLFSEVISDRTDQNSLLFLFYLLHHHKVGNTGH